MRPGQERALELQKLVLDVLKDGGSTQADLAWLVKAQLLPRQTVETCRRRVKEAVSALVELGHPVVSDSRGYRLAISEQDRAAGRRFLVAQIRSLSRRLAAYDRAEAERVQMALDWGA